jgi:hypothetical protein
MAANTITYDEIVAMFNDFKGAALLPRLRMLEHPSSGNILLVNFSGRRPIVRKYIPVAGSPGLYRRPQ